MSVSSARIRSAIVSDATRSSRIPSEMTVASSSPSTGADISSNEIALMPCRSSAPRQASSAVSLCSTRSRISCNCFSNASRSWMCRSSALNSISEHRIWHCCPHSARRCFSRSSSWTRSSPRSASMSSVSFRTSAFNCWFSSTTACSARFSSA